MCIHQPNSNIALGNQFTPLDHASSGVFYFLRSLYTPTLCIIIGLISLSSLCCNEKISTPDWSSEKTEHPETLVKSNLITEESNFTKPLPKDSNPGSTIRFVSYNLRNYLTMRRGLEEKFKPSREVSAVINNIVRAKPDILGVCEIGTQQDLEHLQNKLRQAGCHLPHIQLSIGDDPYRRQALLSRFPLKYNKVPKYTYQMKGKRHQVRRGILDITAQTPRGYIRFLGAHLKSKRPIAVYDQAEIRRAEAQILRKHASQLLKDSSIKLLVFGDMNDTKGSSTIRLMKGYKEGKLTSIELFDKYGTKWTQYWAKEDIYSRFDYVFASKSMLPMIDQKESFILETPVGDPASDHRALVILIQ